MRNKNNKLKTEKELILKVAERLIEEEKEDLAYYKYLSSSYSEIAEIVLE